MSADGELRWRRDNPVEPPPDQLTRRSVFAWCGQLVAHLPVCGWLRPAVAWLKRRVNALTRGWDDVTEDSTLREQLRSVMDRVTREDPARGPWRVTGNEATVWVDASSIATGVVVESPEGAVVEDACWLRTDTSTHINMAELEAALRGVNLAIAWGMKSIALQTDSATVHKWISDALSGRARLRTKAHGEMLIRRRVDLIRQLVSEFQLSLSVRLVPSAENRADDLTRVPKDWVRDETAVDDAVSCDDSADGTRLCGVLTGAAARDGTEVEQVQSAIECVHEQAGHPGVRKTLHFARRELSRSVTRTQVQSVVRQCDVCNSIDPAPVKWRHGSLAVSNTWNRLALDVTHHRKRHYLTITDCGPSRFSIWKQLRRLDSNAVIEHLEEVFFERGAPLELLLDNGTAFRSREFALFAARWNVNLRFRAVYEPSGNGIVERSHRTVKVIAARKECSIAEAVHLYNVSPRDEEQRQVRSPAEAVYRYTVRDYVKSTQIRPVTSEEAAQNSPPAPYAVGDAVWIRRRGTRCSETSLSGVVTRLVSDQVVEVNDVPWHIRDVRRRYTTAASVADCRPGQQVGRAVDESPLVVQVAVPRQTTESAAGSSSDAPQDGGEETREATATTASCEAQLRRSSRVRRAPTRLVYD